MSDLLVIGSGGIGRALLSLSAMRYPDQRQFSTARQPQQSSQLALDLLNPAACADAVDRLKSESFTPSRIIFAQGLLHRDGQRPEKSLRELDAAWMSEVMQVNAIAPIQFLAQLMPLVPRDAAVQIAFISARVGSIEDNQLGGWYGYRASKAALNMLIKTASVELVRTHPKAQLLALHPGTTDTALSKPFQARVPEGKLFSPEFVANKLLDLLDQQRGGKSGQFLAWDGSTIPW
ncbi:MAG: hypothetical protein RL143_1085 [Pseudomonadota bacterium]|jgi:NAD(P)-dependent dehydrogenase (short-subunit alcohol dehydrogenase family)